MVAKAQVFRPDSSFFMYLMRIKTKSADPEIWLEERNTFRVSRAARCVHEDGGGGGGRWHRLSI